MHFIREITRKLNLFQGGQTLVVPEISDKSLMQTLTFKIAYCEGILAGHGTTSMWNAEKINSLLAANGIFGGGILAFLSLNDSLHPVTQNLVALGLLYFIISILICVYHAIPFYNSGIGNDLSNIRVSTFAASLSRDQYFSLLSSIDLEKLLEHSCHQIVGLSIMNIRTRKFIAYASVCSFIAFSITSLAIVFHFFYS